MALPQFLEDAPSHFNWDLETGTSKEFDALNLQITEHLKFNPNEMTIQALLFQSFLHMSGFKHPKPDLTSFKACLETAYEKINALDDGDEKSGYLLVAKCNEAIVAGRLKIPDLDLEDDIEDLMPGQSDKLRACVHSVKAFALSRLGLPKYKDTETCYREAVKICPENPQWLFGLALVIGRQARITAPPFTFTDEMQEELDLLEKVLSLDDQHALARATLAQCLLLKKDYDGAIEHAKISLGNQPKNPYLLSMAGKVLRRTKQFDDAICAFQLASELNSEDTFLYHQFGLVYRDKYQMQECDKEKAIKDALKNKHEPNYTEPDQNLLRSAVKCFSKAVKGNITNNMALLDKARGHADLGELEQADADFNSLLATQNLSERNRFTFNFRYALFLQVKRKDDAKAAKHFCTAIELAVNYCTKVPVTRENPTPQFRGLSTDIGTAIESYRDIMSAYRGSSDPEKVSQGLKGLAWLHQALGEHDTAKERYEEYLQCVGKSSDYDAIHRLIKTLIQLDDLEGAREKIQHLKTLKPRLAQRCHTECVLRQGELYLQQATPGGVNQAKLCFQEVIADNNMEGCHKLADILKNEAEVNTWEFRLDCAMILHCCERNGQKDSQLFKDVTNMMKLDDETCGTLRKLHLNMEKLILNNSSQGDDKEILTSASQVLNEARSLLDRMMSKFQEAHYPPLEHARCMFFYISQEDSNVPRTEQDVKTEVIKKLKKYKWQNFDTKFQDLLDFLVKVI